VPEVVSNDAGPDLLASRTELADLIAEAAGGLTDRRGARATSNSCPELAAILDGWDGRFTILLRKRAARHIDDCGACEQERKARLNPVALLGATPVFLRACRHRRRKRKRLLNKPPPRNPCSHLSRSRTRRECPASDRTNYAAVVTADEVVDVNQASR
jgi:hypothetical protein